MVIFSNPVKGSDPQVDGQCTERVWLTGPSADPPTDPAWDGTRAIAYGAVLHTGNVLLWGLHKTNPRYILRPDPPFDSSDDIIAQHGVTSYLWRVLRTVSDANQGMSGIGGGAGAAVLGAVSPMGSRARPFTTVWRCSFRRIRGGYRTSSQAVSRRPPSSSFKAWRRPPPNQMSVGPFGAVSAAWRARASAVQRSAWLPDSRGAA